MDPIQKALAEVRFAIPPDILNRAFVPKTLYGQPTAVNLDSMIREKVIEARVRVDCDLQGGTQINLPLGNLTPEYLDLYNLIYRIPKHMTQNRSITRVLDMAVGYGSVWGTTNMGLQGSSPLLDAASGALAAASPIPIVSTAYVDLIAENTVLISDALQFPVNAYLRCIVENDKDFTTLPPQAFHYFATLVELATKAYIYNTLTIQIGSGEIQAGQELGRFKEIVDGYADANDLYKEFLRDTWREVAVMSDPISFQETLRMLTGGVN